jgi:hypothetical protein
VVVWLSAGDERIRPQESWSRDNRRTLAQDDVAHAGWQLDVPFLPLMSTRISPPVVGRPTPLPPAVGRPAPLPSILGGRPIPRVASLPAVVATAGAGTKPAHSSHRALAVRPHSDCIVGPIRVRPAGLFEPQVRMPPLPAAGHSPPSVTPDGSSERENPLPCPRALPLRTAARRVGLPPAGVTWPQRLRAAAAFAAL